MPKLLPEEEKNIEEKLRLQALLARNDEEKTVRKDNALFIGLIFITVGLLVYTFNAYFGSVLVAMGLVMVIYKFLP